MADSRRRNLLRDLAQVLGLQMRYWGIDAQGGDRSLLVAAGLRRVARQISVGEGSSRYREPWQGGWIEIHSFCAGYYDPTSRGIMFSRADERIYGSAAGDIPDPARHRKQISSIPPDSVLQLLPAFLSWVLDFEGRIERIAARGYRERCWKRLGGHRLGPLPDETLGWLASLLRSPQTTLRLRQLRDERPETVSAPAARASILTQLRQTR